MWILGFILACVGVFAFVYWLLWLFSREHMDAVMDRDYEHAEARRNRRLRALGLIDDNAPRAGVCGLRVEAPNGAPVFVCTEPLGHGGRLHRNAGATWDEVARGLRRGTHVLREGE